MSHLKPPAHVRSINLAGDGIMRGFPLVLPTDQVRRFLPPGLTLGEQELTPPGTHPIMLFFQNMISARMTVPTLLPAMTYLEYIFGVPFTYVVGGQRVPGFYMPRLFLNDSLAVLGGVLFWGFAKRMTTINLTQDRFSVMDMMGGPMTSLDFEPTGEYRPISRYPHFEAFRQIMSQPLVSQVPAGVGPWSFYSNFDKKWDDAVLRPLSSVVQIDKAFLPGLPLGRFPSTGRLPGIDVSPIGSYEVKARFRQSLVYP